jgi:hypothetical protein
MLQIIIARYSHLTTIEVCTSAQCNDVEIFPLMSTSVECNKESIEEYSKKTFGSDPFAIVKLYQDEGCEDPFKTGASI